MSIVSHQNNLKLKRNEKKISCCGTRTYKWLLTSANTHSTTHISSTLLSTPMGVDYVVIGFDMEVKPLVTHNAA